MQDERTRGPPGPVFGMWSFPSAGTAPQAAHETHENPHVAPSESRIGRILMHSVTMGDEVDQRAPRIRRESAAAASCTAGTATSRNSGTASSG